MDKAFPIYLAAVNAVAFVMYGSDKLKAKKGKQRIRELTLMTAAAVGGSIGSLAAMRLFHHKTRHKKFTVGIPLMLAVQIAALIYISRKYL